MGLLTEVVAEGKHLERAIELANNLAKFPQRTMLADRRAAIEGLGMTLEEGLALESQAGPDVFARRRGWCGTLRSRRGARRRRSGRVDADRGPRARGQPNTATARRTRRSPADYPRLIEPREIK